MDWREWRAASCAHRLRPAHGGIGLRLAGPGADGAGGFVSGRGAQTEQPLTANLAKRPQNSIGTLRLLFGSLVIVAYSLEKLDGDSHRERLHRLSGTMVFGGLAVDAFFLICGFLIAASLARAPRPGPRQPHSQGLSGLLGLQRPLHPDGGAAWRAHLGGQGLGHRMREARRLETLRPPSLAKIVGADTPTLSWIRLRKIVGRQRRMGRFEH
jgi:hypothetical protein